MTRDQIKQRFNIIGNNAELNLAIDIAIQVAPTEVTVLVFGENGTGKDNFSKIIHALSTRKHKPFIAINCGAIPEGTMDSELFGHEKGSFTSAHDSRKGYFEESNGGVIFLDEIAEMPMATQSRLLRLLENGEYMRVGSSKVQKSDVRVVAATNKNLIDAIRNNKFREDLYFRLNTITIQVPPLRERGNDVELLFRYFASYFGEKYGRKPVRLEQDAVQWLYKYTWPGNVRELRNFVEKLSVLAHTEYVSEDTMAAYLPLNETLLPILSNYNNNNTNSGTPQIENELLLKMLFDIKREINDLRGMLKEKNLYTPAADSTYNETELMHFPLLVGNGNTNSNGNTNNTNGNRDEIKEVISVQTPLLEESLSLEKKEKDMILRALNKFKHNRKKAATELGISERTLYRKIKAYDLE